MTKKHKSQKFFIIDGSIFPYDILVSLEDTESIIKYINNVKKYKLSELEIEKLEMEGGGKTIQLKNRAIVVRVRKEKTQIGFDLPVMIHELSHAVQFIFETTGVEDKSGESFAYFIEYLTRKVLDNWGR
jgi:hypothetical protein